MEKEFDLKRVYFVNETADELRVKIQNQLTNIEIGGQLFKSEIKIDISSQMAASIPESWKTEPGFSETMPIHRHDVLVKGVVSTDYFNDLSKYLQQSGWHFATK